MNRHRECDPKIYLLPYSLFLALFDRVQLPVPATVWFILFIQGRHKGLVINYPNQEKRILSHTYRKESTLKLSGSWCQSLHNKPPWGSYSCFLHKSHRHLFSRIFERSKKYWFLIRRMKDKQLQQFPSHSKNQKTEQNTLNNCFQTVDIGNSEQQSLRKKEDK